MSLVAPVSGPDSLGPPGVARRLACFLYESILLFGVLMLAAYVFSSLTQQRHALQGKAGLQAFLFVILGIYFGWFWSRGGQTLAMKTWHLRVVRSDGKALSQARAVARYVASWLWFLPALITAYAVARDSSAAIFSVVFAGLATYSAIALCRTDRRFLHDVICDCKVIDARSSTRSATEAAA